MDGQQRTTRWVWRVIVLFAGPPFIYWMAKTFGVVALFPLVGWAILLVWLFDAPQLVFSLFEEAEHKVAGVEGAERHEWYGFRGGSGLNFFDGPHLYSHVDARQGEHQDWGTLIFNYGRNEVRSFLLSNALFWLDVFHADGLRVDAVPSMLYLDYSRKEGEWIPNEYGGRENLAAITFLRRLNEEVYRHHPDVHMIAEESTSWPMVSRPTYVGGLGFGLKWDMGWMHDRLRYFRRDPVHRMVPPQRAHHPVDGYPADFHVRDFLDCVKSRGQSRANAVVACWAHIACHAANVALFLGRKVKYDPVKNEFVNDAEANRLRSEALREPWRV